MCVSKASKLSSNVDLLNTYLYVHVYIFICTYIHTYVRTYMHTLKRIGSKGVAYVCIYIYMYTDIHAYIHTNIHTYMHAYIHTHIHAYMHTCIHTYAEARGQTARGDLSQYLYFCTSKVSKLSTWANSKGRASLSGGIGSFISRVPRYSVYLLYWYKGTNTD